MIFVSLLSENVSPKAWAGARTQSSFLVLVPLHVNHCMYTQATRKESVLAHTLPKEAGRRRSLLLSGNWQPFFFCKRQPHVTSCSSDSRPTLEILEELLKSCHWLNHRQSHLSKCNAEKFIHVRHTGEALNTVYKAPILEFPHIILARHLCNEQENCSYS